MQNELLLEVNHFSQTVSFFMKVNGLFSPGGFYWHPVSHRPYTDVYSIICTAHIIFP